MNEYLNVINSKTTVSGVILKLCSGRALSAAFELFILYIIYTEMSE